MAYQVYLNNVPVAVKNPEEISLDFSFDDFSPNLQVLESFLPEFQRTNGSRDPVNIIDNWIANNTVAKKIPFRVEDNGQTVFFGRGKLSDESTTYDALRGEVKMATEVEIEQFSELIKNFKLLDLYEKAGIPIEFQLTRDDFDTLRTIRDDGKQYIAAAILALAVFQSLFILANLIREIADLATKGLLTPVYLVASVIYVAATIAALYAMLVEIQDALFPEPKAYATVRWELLLRNALGAIGYSLDTDIFNGDYNLISFWASTSLEGVVGNRRTTNQPIPDISLGDFLDVISDFFGVKVKPNRVSNVVEIRPPLEYQQTPVNYTIENLKDNGKFRYTVSDAPSSISINFAEDFADLNVVKNSHLVSYGIEGIDDKDLDLGAEEIINIPYSNLKRKNEVTRRERTFLSIINTVKRIGQLFGNRNSIRYSPNEYKRFAVIGQDTNTVGRIFIHDGIDGVDPNSFNLTKASSVYEFHRWKNPLNNQRIEYIEEQERQILNLEDFIRLKNNNVCYDWDGNKAIIKSHLKDVLSGLYRFTFYRNLKPSEAAYIDPSRLIERREDGV